MLGYLKLRVSLFMLMWMHVAQLSEQSIFEVDIVMLLKAAITS